MWKIEIGSSVCLNVGSDSSSSSPINRLISSLSLSLSLSLSSLIQSFRFTLCYEKYVNFIPLRYTYIFTQIIFHSNLIMLFTFSTTKQKRKKRKKNAYHYYPPVSLFRSINFNQVSRKESQTADESKTKLGRMFSLVS